MDEQNTSESSMPNMEGEGMGGKKGMSTKVIIVLVVIVVLGGIYAWARKSDEPGELSEGASVKQEDAAAPAPESTEATEPVKTADDQTATTTAENPPTDGSVTVTFQDSGYVPQDITVKKGTTVNFKNTSASATWPASAKHPTHTVYPGSGIEKCGTADQPKIFDACAGIKTGDTWSFQFNEVGSWKYHNHLNPTQFGSITVTE